MAKIPALKKLNITKEEGLTKDNIDKVIDILLETPKEVFNNEPSGLNKLELLDIYYKIRDILNNPIVEETKRNQMRILLREATPDYFI